MPFLKNENILSIFICLGEPLTEGEGGMEGSAAAGGGEGGMEFRAP